MISPTMFSIVDEVRIVAPDSLNLLTPYVLREQGDWFEDEIKFLRRALEKGQSIIDIGANYGVYTLSIAHLVGANGHVWAFEPASRTADLLAAGISANGFTQVTLERSALSDHCGMAQLSLNENSELNAIVHAQESTSSEMVSLVTLDSCLERYRWENIDFLKIDAEGEEANILRGGKKFFEKLSPLVQYEIKAGPHLNIELVELFAAHGYESYRLVPGLDLLVPFEGDSQVDRYLLNLFCCKRDRTRQLSSRGLLLDKGDLARLERSENKNWRENASAYAWYKTIAKLPYGMQLADIWEQTSESNANLTEALSLYLMSRDSSLLPAVRFMALERSLELMKETCEGESTFLRLGTLSRVARDYGARELAVDALERLATAVSLAGEVDPSEIFLPPSARFDFISPGDLLSEWIISAVLEEFERLESFSSFYSGVAAQRRIEAILALGFGSQEMEHRLELIKQRFNLRN